MINHHLTRLVGERRDDSKLIVNLLELDRHILLNATAIIRLRLKRCYLDSYRSRLYEERQKLKGSLRFPLCVVSAL